MSQRVLIVEDDPSIARVLKDNLEYEGFGVESAGDASEALTKLRRTGFDLILLDLMLPGSDGLDFCRELGRRSERPPIIILSARSQKEDKVMGLNLGADDYVTKPFALEELLARIHAVLRRSRSKVESLALGDVVIDFRSHQAERKGRDLGLTRREFQVLQYLAERPGKLVTRDELLHEVWGYRDAPLTRSVDLTVARLRRKIEPDPHHPRFIRTLHGDGYSLTPPS